MESMCEVHAMTKDGTWYWWGVGKHAEGWGEGEAPKEIPQAKAAAFAKSTMVNVPWVWGVKIVPSNI